VIELLLSRVHLAAGIAKFSANLAIPVHYSPASR